MLNSHKISAKLCRLCGKEKARGTYVFKDKVKGAVLVSIINKYFSKEVINVSATDSHSKYVCMDCEQIICSFDEFCLMVANVQKQLTAPSIEIDFTEDMLCHFKETGFIDKDTNEARTEKKQHTCDQCAKSFRCQAHLDRHRRIHTGQRPFVCNICRMSFNQPEILATHMESHQGKKEFRCSTCLQSFRFKVSLKSHMLNFHSDPDNPPLNGLNNYLTCTECGKAFATKYKLQRHIRSHTGERPFRCNFCHRTFSQTGNLKLHLTKCSRNTEQLLPEQILVEPGPTNEFIPEEIHQNEVDRLALNDYPPVFISESEIQKTINETINETINSSNDPTALRSYDNQIYIDNDIETILDRDLGELNCEGEKYDGVDKLALLKEPETPELLQSLLYDV